MAKFSLVKILYLYLFSAIGLIIFIIGSVDLINLGLKTYVFTYAEKSAWETYHPQPPLPFFSPNLTPEKLDEKICNLSDEEKNFLRQWMADYQNWQTQYKNINYALAEKQKKLSLDLAMIIVGLPLYIYHWLIVKKEKDNGEKV